MAKRVPLLSEMREPPQIGRFYLVPVVHAAYCGMRDDWPVLGPLHTDVEHFKFHAPHYHDDPRFLSKRQVSHLIRYGKYYRERYADVLAALTGGYPLSTFGDRPPKGRPPVRRRKCRSAFTPYVHKGQVPVEALRADYSDPARPIYKADGRKLCPHRKVNLSNLVPDEDGIVTCPLHGLRVDCRVPA